MRWLTLITLVISTTASCSLAQDTVPREVCYIRSASFQEGFSFDYDNAVPCTHIILSNVNIDQEEGIVQTTQTDINNMMEVVNFKKTTGNTFYTMVQIGGEEDGERYSLVTADPMKRKRLVDSIVELVKNYTFDGVDINWRFPGIFGNDKKNLLSFIQELRSEFEKSENRMDSGRRRRLISLVLPNSKDGIVNGYNILAISPVVDFLNLLSFNFISSGSPWLDHNAPLFSNSTSQDFKENNVEFITKLYLRVGSQPKKLVVGIPLFGRRYLLASEGSTTPRESSIVPYNKICQMIRDDDWKKLNNSEIGPFIQKDLEIISYDDEESITRKANFVKNLRLGGVMFWSMDMGDWNSSCSDSGVDGKWPLIKTALNIVGLPHHSVPADFDNFPLGEQTSLSTDGTSTVASPLPVRGNPSEVRPFQNINVNSGLPVAEYGLAQSGPVATFPEPDSPFFTIVESDKDITIDEISIEFNENHWPKPPN